MKKALFIAAILLTLNLQTPNCFAGDSIDFKARAAYSIGGTMPLGVPASIRSIDAFRLTPSVMVGADINLHFNKVFGVATGLRFENKGMNIEITAKSYRMEIKKGDSQLNGLFTGHVKQEVAQWMLSLPLQLTCRPSDNVTLKAGPYVSLLLSKKFSGIAFDGYIRQGNPTGPRVDIGSTEADWATYDFSDELRSLQWGVSIGIDCNFTSHIGLSADLNWGLSGILPDTFTTVEQTLYPVYGTLGLFYRF